MNKKFSELIQKAFDEDCNIKNKELKELLINIINNHDDISIEYKRDILKDKLDFINFHE